MLSAPAAMALPPSAAMWYRLSAPSASAPASGPAAWYDFSDSTTLFAASNGTGVVTNNGNIARANDKSGNGRDLYGWSTVHIPWLDENSLSRPSSFYHAGYPFFRTLGEFNAGTNPAITTFVVLRHNDAFYRGVFGWGNSAAVALSTYGKIANSYAFGGGNSFNIIADATNTVYIHTSRKTPGAINSTMQTWRNGVTNQAAGSSAGQPNLSTNQPLYVGGWGSYGLTAADGRFRGNIGELLIYWRDLSDPEIEQTWEYLNKKWSVY